MRKIVLKKEENKQSNSYGFASLKEEKSFQILRLAVEELKERFNLSPGEILSLIEEKPVAKDILIPVSVFEAELSALEAVCKYLKEDTELNFRKIALLLNRDDRTIWATYSNACKKRKERLIVKDSRFFVPVSVLADRRFSVLEAIVTHLKDKFGLRYSQIADLLNRNERNVWTICNRAKKK